jgi:tRNA(fMet)-specific endonuclease VapC
MNYLLDTNICIYTIRQSPPQTLKRFREHSVGEIGISSITAAELWFGVEKSKQKKRNSKALDQFLFPLEIVPFDVPAAITYGVIRTRLESQGTPIGPLDTLIAAHALSLGAILVTNNEKEFKRIARLQIENWASLK